MSVSEPLPHFVDDLFGAAPALGMPFLAARFPRSYVDANREPYELDPTMFEDELPAFAIARSARVAAGLVKVVKVGVAAKDAAKAVAALAVPAATVELALAVLAAGGLVPISRA